MRSLSQIDLEKVKGGLISWGDVADGVCTAAAGMSVGAIVFKTALRVSGTGALVLATVDVACFGYELSKHVHF